MHARAQAAATIAGEPLGLATAQSSALIGLDPHPVRVEVCSSRGPAFFRMVGLADAAVREARVRVASALARLGILLDEYAVTVNLAPADLRKNGAALDLAIGVALLAALGRIPVNALERTLLLGELSLDGKLRPVRGVLPQLEGARHRGLSRAIVPTDNAAEAGLVIGMTAFYASSLEEVAAHFTGSAELAVAARNAFTPETSSTTLDFSDLRGQGAARRAAEIAAAGGHNLLMIGPPGGGKTMLARLLPTILPPLSYEEAIDTTAVHSVAGLVEPSRGVVSRRPFRAPHHSVSEAGLVGGGDIPRPGEVSLAHNGVLFLDELAEFSRNVLEALRQPLEDGTVCISRARARALFPARPMVVAAVNPCPCGYLGHPVRECRCTQRASSAYRARLSGPLLDRLDVHVTLPPVGVEALCGTRPEESSTAIRERVQRARSIQHERFERGEMRARLNALLDARDLSKVSRLGKRSQTHLSRAVERLGLSARGYSKVLRIARTIADLEDSAVIQSAHVSEAIQSRLIDRPVFS